MSNNEKNRKNVAEMRNMFEKYFKRDNIPFKNVANQQDMTKINNELAEVFKTFNRQPEVPLKFKRKNIVIF